VIDQCRKAIIIAGVGYVIDDESSLAHRTAAQSLGPSVARTGTVRK